MERGSLTPFVIGLAALVALICLHIFGAPAAAAKPAAPNTFAGPPTHKPQPIPVERNEPTRGLRRVRCAGAAAPGIRCFTAVR